METPHITQPTLIPAKHENTIAAKKSNLTYLIILGILITVSILIPPPFGSTAGLIVAVVGIIYGISIRKLSKKEHPKNSIAKTGITISIIWLLWNLLVLAIVVAGILLFTALSGVIQL